MTSITKAALFAALSLTLAFPASAAERPTKGTKSYQAAKTDSEQSFETAKEEPVDVSDIEPAAGGDMDMPQSEGKSFKEEMRLPRKN
jgi:hypothetical protein